MLKLSQKHFLQYAIIFAVLHNFIYETLHPEGILRLAIVFLMNLSIILIIWCFIRTLNKKIDIHPYFKAMYSILIFWSLFTIFRSLSLSSAITIFGHYGGGWTWILPICATFGLSISNWFNSFKYIGQLLLIASLIGLGSFFYSDSFVWGLMEIMVLLPVMLLTYLIQNRKNRFIIIISIIVFLIMSFKVSQRTGFVFLLILMFFNLIEYIRISEINIFRKVIFGSILLVCGLFLLFNLGQIIDNVSNNKEAATDTRTFLFVEQYADTTEFERIIGRGAMGTYYSEYFELWNEMGFDAGDSATRWTNEVGYLHIMLKGGYIMIILYLSILIPAAYLGIFRSKNSICRMCGYYILGHILIWTISFSPLFGAQFILLWMAVGTAISSSARNMTIKKVKRNYLNDLNFGSR